MKNFNFENKLYVTTESAISKGRSNEFAVKEAIKNYKENYRDPLLKITNIIKDYDSGFPERKVEDEYETCSHVH